MAGVVKAKVGVGYLAPGQTTWWKWFITRDDAWYFWAGNDGGVGPGETPEDIEVVRMVCREEWGTSVAGNAALIQLRNPGPTTAYFTLRVVRVY